MRVEVCTTIDDVPAEQWDRLVKGNNPFLHHAFLAALEHNNCASPTFGWRPMHLAAWEGKQLVAAMPLYLKDNSYGEFVFDHAWAQAYQRQSLSYYPKLVSSIPYAPATGQRMLLADELPAAELSRALLDKAIEVAGEVDASSLHWLFIDEEESRLHHSMGLMLRNDVQFHWHNRDYADFDAFLAELNAKRRKNIRRERRLVAESGLRLQLYHGDEVDDADWELFARMYEVPFEQRYSLPTLNSGFFKETAKAMGRQVILVLAYDGDEAVAGAGCYAVMTPSTAATGAASRSMTTSTSKPVSTKVSNTVLPTALNILNPAPRASTKSGADFCPPAPTPATGSAIPSFLRRLLIFSSGNRRPLMTTRLSLRRGRPIGKDDRVFPTLWFSRNQDIV